MLSKDASAHCEDATVSTASATGSQWVRKVPKTRTSSKHQTGACCFCKKRRKKCDGGYPSCGSCKLNGISCTVVDISTGREVPRNYLETLELEIELLKKKLEKRSEVSSSNSRDESAALNEKESSEESDSVTENGLPLEVGYITLAAAGEPRYIGLSSAYSIARAIHSTIYHYQKQKGDFQPNGSGRFSITASGNLEGPILETEKRFQKPTITNGQKLIEAYYSGVQFQYPFLDWEWVLACFEKVVQSDTDDNESLFFVYILFAIGSQLLESSGVTCSDHHTRAYYDKAFDHIGPIVEGTSIRAVQAYLLLSVFSQKMPHGSSIWQTTGLALRTAVALGLHRKPYQTGKVSCSLTANRDQDLKSRIFWCTYSMERINGLVLGRPFGIADADIDVPLPESEQYAVSVHVFKLRMLQSSICTFVYKPRPSPTSTEEMNAIRRQIMLELNEWKSTFPYKRDAETTWETENWCTISYHNSVLLLLRPVVLEVSKQNTKTSPATIDWFTVFTQSASAICLNYKYLHAKGKLSYTWLAIQCVFVAGVTFLYCIWLDTSLKFLQLARKTIVYDTISACSNILYVLAERWEGAQMFRNSFEHLSSAVLAYVESGVSTNDLLQSPDLNPNTTPQDQPRYPENLYYDSDFQSSSTSFAHSSTDGISFSFPQGKTSNFPPSAELGVVDTTSETVWDFLSSTADTFIKDMFSNLERAFDQF
ncbi:uncharacterized protein LALA0_S05e09868g [Lachancea lanzarotensis]|uniref:LALA0S05e09868g1_1 n=1 Tax=Lachancea lanzarotensis TaxID=1245769 RepID=A0A0C7MRT5_9SACH|nr:uncharacterized protein LALA0_S05e09868g [Lachancea lanzarotensis]CEP62628.1 LALA0S05e09868g1_1 [Lachancea lanzarotensis]